MLVFAMDTATLQGSYGFVEIRNGDPSSKVLRHATLDAPAAPGHAETVLHRMGEVLACGGFSLKDIDLLIFGRGPGTFTGVRIGLSTVKGVAMACNCPVLGLSSLEALALSSGGTGLVAALIDARRRELFGALYEVSFTSEGWPVALSILDERVAPADQMVAEISRAAGTRQVLLTGNGISPYEQVLVSGLRASILPETTWTPSAFWMARVGLRRFLTSGPDDLDAVEPVYLREPDARLPAVKQP